jgi:hypothetical protein
MPAVNADVFTNALLFIAIKVRIFKAGKLMNCWCKMLCRSIGNPKDCDKKQLGKNRKPPGYTPAASCF